MYRSRNLIDRSLSDLNNIEDDIMYNAPEPKNAKHVIFVVVGKGRTQEEDEFHTKAANQ